MGGVSVPLDPLPELRLPRLSIQQAPSPEFQVYWQTVVEQIEAAYTAINDQITAIQDAQAAADAAQDAAIQAAQDAADAALAAANAQTTADGAVTDAADAMTAAGAKVDKDAGPLWSAPSGTASRLSLTSYAGQTVSNPPTQSEVQSLDDAVKALGRATVAIITDLRSNHALTP